MSACLQTGYCATVDTPSHPDACHHVNATLCTFLSYNRTVCEDYEHDHCVWHADECRRHVPITDCAQFLDDWDSCFANEAECSFDWAGNKCLANCPAVQGNDYCNSHEGCIFHPYAAYCVKENDPFPCKWVAGMKGH